MKKIIFYILLTVTSYYAQPTSGIKSIPLDMTTKKYFSVGNATAWIFYNTLSKRYGQIVLGTPNDTSYFVNPSVFDTSYSYILTGRWDFRKQVLIDTLVFRWGANDTTGYLKLPQLSKYLYGTYQVGRFGWIYGYDSRVTPIVSSGYGNVDTLLTHYYALRFYGRLANANTWLLSNKFQSNITEFGKQADTEGNLKLWNGATNYYTLIRPNENASTNKTLMIPDLDGTFALGTGTSNQIAYWVNANTLAALTTATYPSLAEISYIKGLSSSAQTQITNRAIAPATNSDNYIPLWSGVNSKTLANGLAYTSLATASTIVSRNGSGDSYFHNVVSQFYDVGVASSLTGIIYFYHGLHGYYSSLSTPSGMAYSVNNTLPSVDGTLISSGGSYSNPSWITGLAWSKISSTPITLSGYGITDGASLTADQTFTGMDKWGGIQLDTATVTATVILTKYQVTSISSTKKSWLKLAGSYGGGSQLIYIGGGVIGRIIHLSNTQGSPILVKHLTNDSAVTGNIRTNGTVDRTLNQTNSFIVLMYDGTNWQEQSYSNNQ